MNCRNCGVLVAAGTNFCHSCGASVAGGGGPAPVLAHQPGLLLGPARVIVLSVVSAGLYLFFWSYLTWRQLEDETGEKHYPVWHALTLLVPIYAYFRFGKHLSVINDLATRARVTSLGVGAGVTLLILSSWLDLAVLSVTDVTAILILQGLSTLLIVAILYFAQEGLNGYWRHKHGGAAVESPIHWAEAVLAVIGLLVWVDALLAYGLNQM